MTIQKIIVNNNPRVLVIDDDLSFLKLTQITLEKYDYEVFLAQSGEEALVKIPEYLPDILLLDINLQNGMDGHEVCKRLKKNSETKDIPVILVSASSEKTDKVKGFSLGAVDYIHKPFPQEEILARIGMHIKNSTPYTNRTTIKRAIEFPPEYLSAGLSILNYFSTVLQKKHPNQKAKVRIEQEGLKVIMIIEPQKGGEKEVIEKALDEYGLLITGNISPEEYTNDRLLLIELKSELRVAKAQLETQRDLVEFQKEQIQSKDIQINKLYSILESKVANINIDFSPSIIQSSSQKNINSYKIIINRSKLPDLLKVIETNLHKETRLNKNGINEIQEKIKIIQNELKRETPLFLSIKDNLSSVMQLLMGAAGSMLASPLYNHIEPFIKVLTR